MPHIFLGGDDESYCGSGILIDTKFAWTMEVAC